MIAENMMSPKKRCVSRVSIVSDCGVLGFGFFVIVSLIRLLMCVYRSDDSETAGQSCAFLRCSLASCMTWWCVVVS